MTGVGRLQATGLKKRVWGSARLFGSWLWIWLVGTMCVQGAETDPEAVSRARYKMRAEAGHIASMREYGFLEVKPRLGSTNDPLAALVWIRRAADLGDLPSQVFLAGAAIRGFWGEINEEESLKWARKAADSGDLDGQFILRELYRGGIGNPRSESEEPEKILQALFRKGYGHALAIVSERMLFEEGYERNIPYAVELATSARRKGGSGQKFFLVSYNAERVNEPPSDLIGRYVWAYQRIRKDDPLALHIIGEAFSTKEVGPVDYPKAVGWFQKAADAGHVAAWERLGYLHEIGLGVAKDLNKAAGYYQKAAATVPAAKEALERLTKPTGGQRSAGSPMKP